MFAGSIIGELNDNICYTVPYLRRTENTIHVSVFWVYIVRHFLCLDGVLGSMHVYSATLSDQKLLLMETMDASQLYSHAYVFKIDSHSL